MTIAPDVTAPAPIEVPPDPKRPRDHRGSWIPTFSMISTRFMELRKRRGLMIAMILVNIGLPVIFLSIRLISHAVDPKSYGPAGGYDIYSAMVVIVLFVFGFIIAATLGATAGSVDLTDGMFRHLVVTGRSRTALYLARIPAGLAIVVPMIAAGFLIVCAVCTFAAPTTINDTGAKVPAGLSQAGLEQWAVTHTKEVLCNLPNNEPITLASVCGGPGPTNNGQAASGGPGGSPQVAPSLLKTPNGIVVLHAPTKLEMKFDAVAIAKQDYPAYKKIFLSPPVGLMIRTGLWIELEAAIGFIVGLGLASLIGQRTVAVVLMIVLELILTPIFSRNVIPHFINLQRGIVGLATSHLEPAGLMPVFGGDGGSGPGGPMVHELVAETRLTAVLVIIGWLVFWTVIGAWRMIRRDA